MKVPPNKSILITAFAVLLLFFYHSEQNRIFSQESKLKDQLESYNACDMVNTTFQAGEELTYKVYYNWNFIWLAAGEATFKVEDQGDQYYISAKGRTFKSYEWFFKVRDKYETYVDKETLLPSLFVRNVQEGKYTLYNKVNFDQKAGIANSEKGKKIEEAKMNEFKIEPCIHDVLSIIYFARNLAFDNISEQGSFPVKIFIDDETWPLEVKYKGKEEKKRIKKGGKYNTIKFSPELIAGTVFKKGDQMMVWVSDDENKIPLMIETPVSVGSVKIVLKDYKGLKYDLVSKIK